MNITQIQKKLMYVICCNQSDFDPNLSMQKFYFNLTINDSIQSINIYYWDNNDYHLYFDPAMSISYDDTQSLVYYFDSENIFIPYTSWVVGPIKKVNIQNVYPVCNDFKVDCNKTFDVSFDYLKTNLNFDVNYNSLILDSNALNFTLNSSIFTIYWQTSKDLSFYIINCYLYDNYLIEDCILAFRKDDNLFRFRGAVKYKMYHIINSDNLSYVLDDDFDPLIMNNEVRGLKIFGEENAPSCTSIYLYEKNDLLFCLFVPYYLKIFKLFEHEGLLYLDYIYYSFTDAIIQNASQIYIDFIDSYNCLIVKTIDQQLFFYLFVFPGEDDFKFDIISKYSIALNYSFDVYLINSPLPLVIMIDYTNDKIQEFWLRLPFNLTYLRDYPTFSYDFISSFACNDMFLCLKIIDNGASFLVIYNVSEPSSKLLRYKIPYDPINDRILPLLVREKNGGNDQLFHNLFTTSSIFVNINPNSGVSLKIYKVCDINANIPQIFLDPNIVNRQFYQYTLTISFTNEMMKEMIFFKIFVNISFANSVISLPSMMNKTYLNFVNPPCNGSKYNLQIKDTPFLGPVQNYKIFNEDFLQNENIYSFYFYAFIDKTQDFEEDYMNERNYYGNFIKVVYKDNILIVLSEKNLTFHDLENEYEIVYFNSLNISCYDMLIHPDDGLLYLFCNYLNVLHLKCYEFETKDLSNNKSTIIYSEFAPFRNTFQNYMARLITKTHLLFLVDDGYYSEVHKKRKTIYIYTLPRNANNYTINLITKIGDIDFVGKSFMMSDSVDIQAYYLNTKNVTYSYILLVLMTKSLMIMNVDFDSEKTDISNIFIIDYPIFNQSGFNLNIHFSSVCLLDFNISNESKNSLNFSFGYILSSNLHIYEYIVFINDSAINNIPLRTYTKYYSCIYADDVRPKKFKNFLGSFCTKTDIIDGIAQNGFNYFVLHKIDSSNSFEVSPILALPIYLKSYNFQFITKNSRNTSKDFLILPSFSSLFSEYELISTLSIWIKKDFMSPTKITAYNDISNASIYLNIILTQQEEFPKEYIIIICVFSFLFVLIVGVFALGIYRKKKKDRVLSSFKDSLLDAESHQKLPDINETEYVGSLNRFSTKKNIAHASTSHLLNIRANSFLRVKMKNDKWIDS